MGQSLVNDIDTIVGSGKAVISAEECSVVEIVKEAITSGKPASFYLTMDQAKEVKAWYWTPERIESANMTVVSDEEKSKIKSELDVEVHDFRFSRTKCANGHTYGGFEFLQQGIREHGLDAVKSIFDMKNSTFLQANPTFLMICPTCNEMLRGWGYYDCDRYGGCCKTM
ncbi:hypothetical protein ACIQZO_38600 [Streptomyces sp. NPDC097617]|uniref:hypothetical protein n=1 Tax=Streptomyces sp. NPDC097617 TaxID=3366091 RepID=UPI00382ABD95